MGQRVGAGGQWGRGSGGGSTEETETVIFYFKIGNFNRCWVILGGCAVFSCTAEQGYIYIYVIKQQKKQPCLDNLCSRLRSRQQTADTEEEPDDSLRS